MSTRVESLLENTVWLKRLARTLVNDEFAAEDLVQEALHAGLTTHANPGEWRAWLAGVVRRLALRGHRDRSWRQERELCAIRAKPTDGPPSSRGLEEAELQQKLIAAVLALEEPYRAVVLARFFEGVHLEAIARREGVPGSTVRTRLARALERLRARLDEDFGGRSTWAALALRMSRSPAPTTETSTSPTALRPTVIVAGTLGIVVALAYQLASPEPDRVSVDQARKVVELDVGAVLERQTATEPRAAEDHQRRQPSLEPASRLALQGQLQPASTHPSLMTTYRIAGRVANLEDRAVEGVEVLWCDAQRVGDRSRVVVTDAEGRYAFEFSTLDEALRARAVCARHSEYLARPHSMELDETSFVEGTATINLHLEPGASARFLVTDPEGRAIPEVKVLLAAGQGVAVLGSWPYFADDWLWRDWRATFQNARLATAWTDSDGACVLGGIEPGANELVLWARGWLPRVIPGFDVVPGDESLHVFVLERGTVARGSVVDADGIAVVGAAVFCCLSNRWAASVSAEDGTFEIGGLPFAPETNVGTFLAVHPDHAPLWCGRAEGVDHRLPLEGAVLRLDRGRTLELRLVDSETGQWLQGTALVETERSSHVDGPLPEATRAREVALENGWLRLERVGSFASAMWIVCPGYDVHGLALSDPNVATGETISMRPARTWELELVDESSGEPVLGGRLDVGMDISPRPDLPSFATIQIDSSLAPECIRENRIQLDSSWMRWSDHWTLNVNAPGYASRTILTSARELRTGPDLVRVLLSRP